MLAEDGGNFHGRHFVLSGERHDLVERAAPGVQLSAPPPRGSSRPSTRETDRDRRTATGDSTRRLVLDSRALRFVGNVPSRRDLPRSLDSRWIASSARIRQAPSSGLIPASLPTNRLALFSVAHPAPSPQARQSQFPSRSPFRGRTAG